MGGATCQVRAWPVAMTTVLYNYNECSNLLGTAFLRSWLVSEVALKILVLELVLEHYWGK